MSQLLDRLLGPDVYDHQEPTSDGWYRPCMTRRFQSQATAEAELARCTNRHRAAMKARYHGRPPRGHRYEAAVDPMADVVDVLRLPWSVRQERLAVLAMAVLFVAVLAGLVMGNQVVMFGSAVGLAYLSWLAGLNMVRAIRYRANGYQLHKAVER